jgi:hypothetical protein
MSDDHMSARAGELLSMAGQAGILHVSRRMERRGCHCDPREDGIELLPKRYLMVGQSSGDVVRYRLTAKALGYLAAKPPIVFRGTTSSGPSAESPKSSPSQRNWDRLALIWQRMALSSNRT